MAVDREYRIRISTEADASGVQQQTQSLNQLGDKTKEAADKVEGHGESFLHAEKPARAFHHVLIEISRESPILGEALRLALNPTTGLIMGSVLALEYFREKHKQAMEQAKAAAEELAADWVKLKDTNAELAVQAHDTATKFLEEYGAISQSHKTVEEQLKRTISKIDDEKKAIEALIEVEKQHALANAQTDEEKQQIEQRFGAKKEAADLHATAEQLAAMQFKLNEAVAAWPKLRQAHDEAMDALAGDKSAKFVEAQKKNIDGLEKSLSTAQQKRAEHEKDVRVYEEVYSSALQNPKDDDHLVATRELAALEDKAKKDAQEVANIKQQIANAEASITRAQTHRQDLEHREASTKSAELENKKTREKLPGDIEDLQRDYQRRSSEQVLKESPLSGVVSAGAGALHALQEHHGHINELSSGQVQAIRDLTGLLQSLGANNTRMIELIQGSYDNITAIATRVVQLEYRAQQLGMHIRGATNNPT